jgi:NAD+ diphosphatase
MAAVPVLSRHAVDRHTAARSDETALDAAWASDRARVIPLTAAGLVPLRFGAPAAGPPESPVRPPEAFYLGSDTDGEWFALPLGPDATPPRGRLGGLREVGADLDDRDAGLVTHAVALLNWHQRHTHCPRCGAPTQSREGGHVRVCTVDGSQHFPRTDPAVIMLITDPEESQALLGRQPSWPKDRFSCLAGFVEAGESAEQAVVRESAEEAGIRVTDVRYVSSQPWPFPASLMLGYRGTADPAEPIDVSSQELEDARWFPRAEIADAVTRGLLLPPPVSIARHLVDRWLAGS